MEILLQKYVFIRLNFKIEGTRKTSRSECASSERGKFRKELIITAIL